MYLHRAWNIPELQPVTDEPAPLRDREYTLLTMCHTAIAFSFFTATSWAVSAVTHLIGPWYYVGMGALAFVLCCLAGSMVHTRPGLAVLGANLQVTCSLAALTTPMLLQLDVANLTAVFGWINVIMLLLGLVALAVPDRTRSFRWRNNLRVVGFALTGLIVLLFQDGVLDTPGLTLTDSVLLIVFGLWAVYDFSKLFCLQPDSPSAGFIGMNLFLDLLVPLSRFGHWLKDIDWEDFLPDWPSGGGGSSGGFLSRLFD